MTAPDGDPGTMVVRLCAANITPVMGAASVVLVVRLALAPDLTTEVILSPAEADALGRDLRANARYLTSGDRRSA